MKRKTRLWYLSKDLFNEISKKFKDLIKDRTEENPLTENDVVEIIVNANLSENQLHIIIVRLEKNQQQPNRNKNSDI